MIKNIKWEQELSNYKKFLAKLNAAIEVLQIDIGVKKEVKEILVDGLIHRFKCTYERACKLMADYAEFQGSNSIAGFRDAIKEAFTIGLIASEEIWVDMMSSRHSTSYFYNAKIADEVHMKITGEYIFILRKFEMKMEAIHAACSSNN